MQFAKASMALNDRVKVKFTSVMLPIVFFVVFDGIALTLNFWISFRLAENAIAINLAGRQRMLSQKMFKALLNVRPTNEPQTVGGQQALIEFSDAVVLFDKTIKGFWHGGETQGGDYASIVLTAITDEESRINLAQGMQVWSQVSPQLRPLVDHISFSDEQLDAAKISLKQNNLLLLQLMNELTSSLEQTSAQEARYIRLLQSTVLIFALINFIVICRRLLANLRSSHNNTLALAKIIDSIETAVILHGHDKLILSANVAAGSLFGYEHDELPGKHIEQVLLENDAGGFGIRRNGSTFKADISGQELFENGELITVCTILDLSEHQQKEQELLQLAYHDMLTGLPNRILLEERLNQELLRAKRNNTKVAVLFLDLDGFKAVNDSFGHDAGDELLKLVSKRLLQCCREVDTVARLGGDEFVIVLGPVLSENAVIHVANIILKRIQQDFLLGWHTVAVGVSIGIAIYPDDHLEGDLLLKYADDAMYQAKRNGKNQYCLNSTITLSD